MKVTDMRSAGGDDRLRKVEKGMGDVLRRSVGRGLILIAVGTIALGTSVAAGTNSGGNATGENQGNSDQTGQSDPRQNPGAGTSTTPTPPSNDGGSNSNGTQASSDGGNSGDSGDGDSGGGDSGGSDSGSEGTQSTSIQPILDQRQIGQTVSGAVRVKQKGSNTFENCDPCAISDGSTIDATNGRIEITVQLPNGRLETIQVWAGAFISDQARQGLTTFTLTSVGPPAVHQSAGGRARIARRRRGRGASTKLWADGHGSFRTKGHYGAANVRGTRWLTIDTPTGTFFKCDRGLVSIRNFGLHKSILLPAGHSIFIRPSHRGRGGHEG